MIRCQTFSHQNLQLNSLFMNDETLKICTVNINGVEHFKIYQFTIIYLLILYVIYLKVYKVGNKDSTDTASWSAVYSFRTLPSGNDWPLTFIMLGDLGVENGHSIPQLEKEAKSGTIHAIFHNGDFAYDFDKVNFRKKSLEIITNRS